VSIHELIVGHCDIWLKGNWIHLPAINGHQQRRIEMRAYKNRYVGGVILAVLAIGAPLSNHAEAQSRDWASCGRTIDCGNGLLHNKKYNLGNIIQRLFDRKFNTRKRKSRSEYQHSRLATNVRLVGSIPAYETVNSKGGRIAEQRQNEAKRHAELRRFIREREKSFRLAKPISNSESPRRRPQNSEYYGTTRTSKTVPVKNGLAGSEYPRNKKALIIGNAKYKPFPLLNPNNDAADMAYTLRSIGFEITVRYNINLSEMETALREFKGKVKSGDAALFYYAGHGVQYKGENYLLPMNSIQKISTGGDLRLNALSLTIILENLADREDPLNIVILDACRRSPFEIDTGIQSGLSRGLKISAKEQDPNSHVSGQNLTGTMIAYSTSPNKVALDGHGRNSPYTRSLLRNLETPDIPIERVLKKTIADVSSATRGSQIPWYESSIGGDFIPFVSGTQIVSHAND
jgi:hypothetical protein